MPPIRAARLRHLCGAPSLFFPPHARGVDIAIEAGTKYLSGHSDLLLGLISANAEWWPRVRAFVDLYAIPPGPDDTFLALRGLRTMELRLRESGRQALEIALWLQTRPEVKRVLHPALPDDPGHEQTAVLPAFPSVTLCLAPPRGT